MATVAVTITTKKQTVPSQPAASSTILIKLMQGGVAKASANMVLPGPLSVSFSNVADGDYNIIAQRMNVQSQPIGDAVTSATFTVANTSDIDVPDAVQVSVS